MDKSAPALIFVASFLIALFGGTACKVEPLFRPEATTPTVSADAIRSHMEYLADDARQGREPGTPGYDAAAEYVAKRFQSLGLRPGGVNNSFMQPVRLRGAKPVPDKMEFIVGQDEGPALALSYPRDFLMSPDFEETQSSLAAKAVFVGFGIEAPKFQLDDYTGLDLRDKIAVVLAGAPKELPGDVRAHFGSTSTKADLAAKFGAIGMVTIYAPTRSSTHPFSKMAEHHGKESMTWLAPDGHAFSGRREIRFRAILNPESNPHLFAGASQSYEQVVESMANGHPKGFDLAVRITLGQGATHRDVSSNNVAGIFEGSDPQLKHEFVVLTAHLDHLGVGHPVEDDGIYNGALDNAAGTATMIEAARIFSNSSVQSQPRRSLLFLAVTAEEKGLKGSEYFVHHPTIPIDNIVANVNLDMPLILYPFADVIAFGAEHSNLGPLTEKALASVDVKLSPDPMPEQGLFTRSDHYPFVQKGIPSIFLVTGFSSNNPNISGSDFFREFFRFHYHRPSDQLDLAIDYEAGAKFALVNYLIANAIANADHRPQWNKNNFFGNLHAKNPAP